MNPAYRCLILDHDDTAVMSTPLMHYPAHVEALRLLRPGRPPIGLEGWLRKNFHPGLMAYLEEELGFSAEEVAASYRIWREHTSSMVPAFFPGMIELLSDFTRLGGLLVVVSHSEVDMIERDYRAAGAPTPDLVFGWTVEESRRKPHPYPVLATMERLELGASDILVVDDLKPGADMAEAAGVDFAAAGWGHSIVEIRDALRPRCRWYFETVGDFRALLLDSSTA